MKDFDNPRVAYRAHQAVSTSLFATATLVAVLTLASRASATRGVSGYSGKPYEGASATCTPCHAAGAAQPSVVITAPPRAKIGSSNEVSIVVDGTSGRTALNAAMPDGVLVSAVQNLRVELAELVGSPSPLNGNTGTYRFSFVAPTTLGVYRIWASGMASDGTSSNGDGVTSVHEDVTVVECIEDGDCGGQDSGRVCDGNGSCVDGCRPEGNGCPAGEECSGEDAGFGQCIGLPDAGLDGSDDAGSNDTGADASTEDDAGLDASAPFDAAVGMDSGKTSDASAGSDGGLAPQEASGKPASDGGCSCSLPRSADDAVPFGNLLAVAVGGLVGRRRSKRS